MALMASSVISPFYVEVRPEVRTSYVSLDKIIEDRPMQVMLLRAGADFGEFGRAGVYNWDVSSLTDRKADIHRHALYHWEWGPFYQYDLNLAEEWTLKSDVICAWTIYHGFKPEYKSQQIVAWWWQLSESLENPYIVPFWMMRRCLRPSDYFHARMGLRRGFSVWRSLVLTPSVSVSGGSSRDYRRMFGENVVGGSWGAGGMFSLSFRLEASWRFDEHFTAFAFVEQYDIIGDDARETTAASDADWQHKDFAVGGVGLRMKF